VISFPLAYRRDDDLLPILDLAGSRPVELIDFPANATQSVLNACHHFSALKIFDVAPSCYSCIVMNQDSSRLGPMLSIISLVGSLLFVLIGIFFFLNHNDAAAAYGVSLSGGADNSWISSAALRDLVYGCLTMTFALLRDRRAVGLCLLVGALIPVGDAIVVLSNSPDPLKYLPLHLGGAIGCLVLAGILFRSGRS
jgi:hypothetical protein